VDHYLVFFAMVLLIQLAAVSVAMFAVSISRNFANASMVTFAVFGASNFTGGCFLPANRLPVYVSWLKWLSYIVSTMFNG
jgi:ABC-type multidrug transport system permease subunit